jgi:HK97 family phage portal protein
MALVVQSLSALVDIDRSWWPAASYGAGLLRMYDGYYQDYVTLYRLQPNVRTCVDFLARNIAQLGLHVFRRVSDTDRERLTDHPLARLLEQPLPPEYKMARYRLVEATMGDLGIYFNAYWLKMQVGTKWALLRVPPDLVTVRGNLFPTQYEVTVGGQVHVFPPERVVHFRGYNPENPVTGLSPLETLRRVLAEEAAAGDYREQFWANAARMAGIIERPADAPEWSEAARARFKAEFEALYAGSVNSGKTAILEEGMTWKQVSFSAQESEYLAGRKLTREECARAYHIPLTMVGILDHATFTNIKDQHKQLYVDCLGPWLAMLEQDIQTQLVPDFEDAENIYVEFNIAEKLQGDFEEQTRSLQAAVGRPWMTADEARARMNLPSMGGDAGRLVTPLNVLVGGQASPRDSAPLPKALVPVVGKADDGPEIDARLPELRQQHEAKWWEVLHRFFARQQRAILSRLPKAHAKQSIDDLWHDGDRWDRELAEDLLRLSTMTASEWGEYVASQAGAEFRVDPLLSWLEQNARIGAQEINRATRDQIADTMLEGVSRDSVLHVFEVAATSRLAEIVTSKVTTVSNLGALSGARQSGLRRKTWVVNSKNPRPSHAALNGVSVGIGELFPGVNMRWPGDPAGGAAEVANCTCSIRFGR